MQNLSGFDPNDDPNNNGVKVDPSTFNTESFVKDLNLTSLDLKQMMDQFEKFSLYSRFQVNGTDLAIQKLQTRVDELNKICQIECPKCRNIRSMRADIQIKQDEQKKQSDHQTMLNQIIRNLGNKIKTVQSNEQEAQRLERINQANLAQTRETKLHTTQLEELTKKFNSAIVDINRDDASQIYKEIHALLLERLKTHPNDAEGYRTRINDLRNILISLYPEIAEKQAAEQEDSNIEEVTKKFNSAIYGKNYDEALRIYQVIRDLIVKHLQKNPHDAEGYQTTIMNLYNLLTGLHREIVEKQAAEQAAEQEGAGNKRKKRKHKKSKKSKKSKKTKRSKKTKYKRH